MGQEFRILLFHGGVIKWHILDHCRRYETLLDVNLATENNLALSVVNIAFNACGMSLRNNVRVRIGLRDVFRVE